MIDVKLEMDEETNQFDLAIENGDFVSVDSFDTALIVSIFVYGRAAASEVPQPQLRRGWWGDGINPDPSDTIGSKFWLLQQARVSQLTLNAAKNYALLCLNWLITGGYSQVLSSTGQFITVNFIRSGIQIDVTIQNQNSKTGSKTYSFWVNTGALNAN